MGLSSPAASGVTVRAGVGFSLGTQAALLRRATAFRSLFFATLVSGIGTWLAFLALQVDIQQRTGSGSWIAGLLIAELLPAVVIGLAFGPLVDRLSRRGLMIGADLLRLAVFCALPFARGPGEIVALALVAGIGTGFFRPAVYAGLPNLVDDADLPEANSLLQAVENLTWAVAPLVGGVIVAAFSVNLAYWINAVTFGFSAALITLIPARRLQAERVASEGHLRDIRAGFALVLSSRALLTVLVAWNVAMIANAAVNVGEIFLAKDSFSAGDFGFGLLVGAAGLGLTLGSLLAASSVAHRGVPAVYGGSIALMAIGTGAAAVAPNVWVAAVAVALCAVGNGAAVVCNSLLVQRGAPDRFRGRTFTALMSSNFVVLVVSMLVAGRLVDAVGPRWVWGVAACVFAVASGLGLALARGVAREPRAEAETRREREVEAPAPAP
jgi:MFS family permease